MIDKLKSAANSVIELSSIMGEPYEVIWDDYIHPLIKQNHSFSSVMEAIREEESE